MSYKLEKPYKEKDKINFIAYYNQRMGLKIEETEEALYALEKNEKMKDDYPVINPDYEEEVLDNARAEKQETNLKMAFEAEENGTVLYNGLVFETNANNVSKLTATLSMINAGIIESVQWLSKDDELIELTRDDLLELGQLIAEFTGALWNVQYLSFKEQIEQAETLEELENIHIEY